MAIGAGTVVRLRHPRNVRVVAATSGEVARSPHRLRGGHTGCGVGAESPPVVANGRPDND